MGVGPRHHDLARLKRLTQGIQRLGRIFGQFVKEQHAVVRQGGLARLGPQAAAGQGDAALVGELAAAVRRQGLRFGVYYSGGIDWSFGRKRGLGL